MTSAEHKEMVEKITRHEEGVRVRVGLSRGE